MVFGVALPQLPGAPRVLQSYRGEPLLHLHGVPVFCLYSTLGPKVIAVAVENIALTSNCPLQIERHDLALIRVIPVVL